MDASTKGLIYPDTFINIASEIGMIHKITMLALENACQFIKSNKEIFSQPISININSNELLNPNFEKNIISMINEFDVSPSMIELEITEKELIKDFKTAIARIKRLKEFGIRFSIDDFGTGYSSITYLQKLPVDSIKIDRSFINTIYDKSNQEIVKMIINIAKTFNMCSIVEGIENESQLDFIAENGADQYQGFYFSKAIDEDSFKELLLTK